LKRLPRQAIDALIKPNVNIRALVSDRSTIGTFMTARNLTSDVSGRDERALFPVAIATCIVLLATLAGLSYLSSAANRDRAIVEVRAVQTALSAIKASATDDARAAAQRLSPAVIALRGAATGPLAISTSQGSAYVVDLMRDFDVAPAEQRSELKALLAAMAPTASGLLKADRLRGAFSGDSDGASWGPDDTRIVVANGRPTIAALLPHLDFSDPTAHRALLFVMPVDDSALAQIARVANTQRIEIGGGPSNEDFGGVRLGSAESGNDVWLQWPLMRPGDDIVNSNAFFLIAFAAIFAALIVFHARRITREAVDGERKAKAVAGQDVLTGLPNRFMFNRLLETEVERVRRAVNDRGAAVLFLDIDRFAEVMDTHGQEIADQLVISLTQRIMGLLRSAGRLARIGHDEFGILQTDIVGPRDAEILGHRIIESLSAPFEIGAHKFYASVSIGIAICPHDADNVEELTHRAELALYRAKNEGRNRYCFFEQRLGDELRLRKTVEDDLRTAIDEGSLVVQYQPVMESTGKRMVGVEALVRWPHPTHGYISPMNFIALAEECDLILPLGEWVLQRALRDIKQWPGLRVAVNVSAIQFRDKTFVPTVKRLLAESDVDPAQLELELTENILLADADSAEDAMIEMRAMGVRLALDDFGTGYSSLIYLRRFAFDKIKIDKSFLDALEATGESAIIVHSIVHLGRALGLTVTAEGVEAPDQHRFLQALGCHELQGYLFSKPVSAAEITRRLDEQNAILVEDQRAVA
jgi:diguanylate cyclase